MNIGELKAAIAELPDDMKVAVIDGLSNDLDTDTRCEPAVVHPGFRDKGGRSFRWDRKGTGDNRVLVIY